MRLNGGGRRPPLSTLWLGRDSPFTHHRSGVFFVGLDHLVQGQRSPLDGRGVFRVSKQRTQRLTFDGTAGGLRSDHIYAIFEDREGVIWFGTDRGVCRFDPHAPRVESIGDNSDSNFVRALFQTTDGRTFAGTNRGLFVYDGDAKAWLAVTELGRNIIYSISEDKQE